jgi:hypothetical protein
VTWYITKTRYERILQEEIDSVKETWARMNRDGDETESTEEIDDSEPMDEAVDDEYVEEDSFTESDMIDYSKIANRYKTSGDVTEHGKEGEEGVEDDVPYVNGPVLILPEDFADGNYDHDAYSLTYYADGVLADDWYKKYDVDETIGEDSVKHFGDYENGVIHVRNERLKADYEVVCDPRNYADIIHNDPLMSAYED